MEEHPNAKIYRKAMEDMASDPQSIAEVLADDVVWWQIGSPEPLRGKEAVLQSLEGFEGVDFDIDLHDVTASDDHVVGLVTATVRVGDHEFSYRTAEIAHIKGGKVTERWAFSDDTEAITNFFSGFAAE